MEGQKELLGMWISEHEGAKFWLAVCTKLSYRGMEDCVIACIDDLTGLPEAIETVFPQTQVYLCMVHMVRHSLTYVNDKLRKGVVKDLKAIYSAATADEAEFQLEVFAEKWDKHSPAISKSWRTHWDHVIPLFAFAEMIRRVISTANATPSVNSTLRKVTQAHRIFPSDDAVYKVLYLAVQTVTKHWLAPISNWKAALHWFALA
jgi:putative transposase